MSLILKFIKKHWSGFSIAILFLTLEAVCDLLQPYIMSKIVDKAVATNDEILVLKLGGIMLATAVVGALSAVIRNYFASKTSQNIGKEMRFELFKKVQSFSLENVDRLDPASLITRITNDVSQIQNFINGCMRILVKAPITCIGAIILIIFEMPSVSPIIAVMILAAALFISYNMKLGYPRFGKVQKNLDSLNNVSRQYLNSVRVVKVFCQEEAEQERFSEVADNLSNSSISATRVNALFNPLINLCVNLAIVGILWFGGHTGGDIEVGKLIASVNYMTQILFALGMVSNILNSMVRAVASSKRIQEIYDEVPAIMEAPQHETIHNTTTLNNTYTDTAYKTSVQNNINNDIVHQTTVPSNINNDIANKNSINNDTANINSINNDTANINSITDTVSQSTYKGTSHTATIDNFTFENEISINNVSFCYPESDRPVLEDINLTIKKGLTYGIIGSTGSGKTTLIQLILRFYDVSHGVVLIDGINIKDLNIKCWRARTALVAQRPILFSGTIESNIRWGNPIADQVDIRKAVDIAQASEFINKSANGYNSILGQGGINLSGGQKQRLSIARAIVRNPEILILDDCTSALDATTEAKVLNGIRDYSHNLTTLIISQRISSVMKTDCIICMDNGRIAGQGSHSYLMKSCDVYREIYDSQIGGDDNG